MSTVTKVKLQPPYVMLKYVVNNNPMTLGIWTHDELERDGLMEPIKLSIASNPISSSPLKSPTKTKSNEIGLIPSKIVYNKSEYKNKTEMKTEKKIEKKIEKDIELEKLIQASKSNKSSNNDDYFTDKEISALNDKKNSNASSPILNNIPIIPTPLSLSQLKTQNHHGLKNSNTNGNNKQTNALLSILNVDNSLNNKSPKQSNTKHTSLSLLFSETNSKSSPSSDNKLLIDKNFNNSQTKKIPLEHLFQKSLSLNNTSSSPIVTTTPVKLNSDNHDMSKLISPQNIFSIYNLNNNVIKNIEHSSKSSNNDSDRFSPTIPNHLTSPSDLISPSDLLRIVKK
jgi:hypothetical protein